MTNSMNPVFDISAKTIRCPKTQTNYYFMQACETIIKPGNMRSWCRYCQHFAEQPETPPDGKSGDNVEANR